MTNFENFLAQQLTSLPNIDHIPSYKRVQIIISNGIDRGILKIGDMLPPERKIAEICNMSIGTIKKAMTKLVHEGRLYRKQGSGTYVSGVSFLRQHRRFYLLLEDFDSHESLNQVKLCSIRTVQSSAVIAKALKLYDSDELFEVTRIFYEDLEKCILVYSYLPASRFVGLDTIYRERLEQVPLYLVLEDDYKTATVHTDELFEAVYSREKESSILGIEENTPILKISSIAYTIGDIPFEYRVSYCVTEKKKLFRRFD